jgi:hypothetical protein
MNLSTSPDCAVGECVRLHPLLDRIRARCPGGF